MKINEAVFDRLLQRIETLASISEEPGQITRPFMSTAMKRVNEVATRWLEAAGASVWEDMLGNIHGRIVGSHPIPEERQTLLLGSHLDTVRDAGKYDGPMGFLVALAAIEELNARGITLPFDIDIVGFSDEEGLRFQTAYLGSSYVAGNFKPSTLEALDRNGLSVSQAILNWGYDPELALKEMRPPRNSLGYLEAHIEQGPMLEGLECATGIVSAIAAQKRVRIEWRGKSDHAGTAPMDWRRDALCGAAEWICLAEKVAQKTDRLRATVGQVHVSSGASNVIPGRVLVTLDIRHPNDELLEESTDLLHAQAMEIAKTRRLGMSWDYMMQAPSVQMDNGLCQALDASVKKYQDQAPFLFSGAGHDAVAMSSAMPVGMLFVRCREGLSHNPAEYVAPEDMRTAASVFTETIRSLGESQSF
ncbi:MAG: M20 family metallo-hydrolase [Opitutales bacterium]